jgi:hypothetical protein
VLVIKVCVCLQSQAGMDSNFIHLVWQKLEEQNPDFFRAYYTRLKLKDQIILFNHILQQQLDQCERQAAGSRYSGVSSALAERGRAGEESW